MQPQDQTPPANPSEPTKMVPAATALQSAPPTDQPQPIPQDQPKPQASQSDGSQARQSLEQLAKAVPYETKFDPSKQPPPAYENIYTEICTEIVKAQSKIMGMDLAVEQAQHVPGLTLDPQAMHSTVVGDGSKVINDLIQQYKNFFGSAAVEVCREATASLLTRLPNEHTPTLLQPQNA